MLHSPCRRLITGRGRRALTVEACRLRATSTNTSETANTTNATTSTVTEPANPIAGNASA